MEEKPENAENKEIERQEPEKKKKKKKKSKKKDNEKEKPEEQNNENETKTPEITERNQPTESSKNLKEQKDQNVPEMTEANEPKESEVKEKKKKKKKKKDKEKNEEKNEEKEQKTEPKTEIETEKKYVSSEDDIEKQALMNIPSKSIPAKRKKKKKKSKKIKEEEPIKETSNDNDFLIEGVELPSLNKNNIGSGGLMLTELLDLDTKNAKYLENLTEEEKKTFLQKKFDKLKLPKSLKKGVNDGIQKTHEDIHDDFKNDILNISNKNVSINDLLSAHNRSLDASINNSKNIFLTRVKISKENIKFLKSLKLEEKYLKNNIAKLEHNKKIIEEGIPLKDNVVDNNIRRSQLKNISNTRNDLMARLEKINQKIDMLLDEEKLKSRNKHLYNFDSPENDQETFNLRLIKMQKDHKLFKKKFSEDIKLTMERKQKECEKMENELKERKKKFLTDMKEKERELFLKRKQEINAKLEKTKKYINEKNPKKEKDYIYYQFKEKFEKEQKKLIEKMRMLKKENLVSQIEMSELREKIKEQKALLEDDAESQKKQLLKLWSYRSQTLPTYHHPLLNKLETERNKQLEDIEEYKHRKECNELEKRNFKPPKVTINYSLKMQIQKEKNNLKTGRENVIQTELNNKKRANKYKFSPIIITRRKKSIDVSQEISNNNYIDMNEVKSALLNKKSKKKIIKSIQILHPKPEKPIDYLTEMIQQKNNNGENKKKSVININQILNDNKNKGGNIIESIKIAKSKTAAIDTKVSQKKEMLQLNGGYLNNPTLGDEVGDLLIESIQAKLNIMNKLNGK